MKPRLGREVIAMRVAKELQDGFYVNLGIGLPTLVANFIPPEKTIIFQSENGILGVGPFPEPGEEDPNLVNAGGQLVTLSPGGCFFHHADSFAMIRGRHIDVAVLGGLQVSEKGDLANWMIPQRGIGPIGGAADLAANAKRVIIPMEHTTKEGEAKIVKNCSYPLTAKECVHLIVTDLAVIEVTKVGLVLKEIAPGWRVEEIQALTEPKLIVDKGLREVEL